MFTITITESQPGAEPVERLTQNLDHLDPATVLKVITILNTPPRRPRSDRGTTRATAPSLGI